MRRRTLKKIFTTGNPCLYRRRVASGSKSRRRGLKAMLRHCPGLRDHNDDHGKMLRLTVQLNTLDTSSFEGFCAYMDKAFAIHDSARRAYLPVCSPACREGVANEHS